MSLEQVIGLLLISWLLGVGSAAILKSFALWRN